MTELNLDGTNKNTSDKKYKRLLTLGFLISALLASYALYEYYVVRSELKELQKQYAAKVLELSDLDEDNQRRCEMQKLALTKEVTVDSCYKTLDVLCNTHAKDVDKCTTGLVYICKIWENE